MYLAYCSTKARDLRILANFYVIETVFARLQNKITQPQQFYLGKLRWTPLGIIFDERIFIWKMRLAICCILGADIMKLNEGCARWIKKNC